MRGKLISLIFVVLAFVGAMFGVLSQPDIPPHRSAITPPPIPMETPFLHRWPTNTLLLHIPAGKTVVMHQVGTMQTDELLERLRSNRYNLYLIELQPVPTRIVSITEEEELVLSNYHHLKPQTP
jgi:hypothetical protein